MADLDKIRAAIGDADFEKIATAVGPSRAEHVFELIANPPDDTAAGADEGDGGTVETE